MNKFDAEDDKRRMNSNEKLIETFYTSFQKLDARAMILCYHPDIRFSDPVFPNLSGAEVGEMWRMLCSQAKNFELTFADIEADERTGKAHWEARYDFSATGRRVHNKINAEFEFQDGKIIRHKDTFDFWKWSSQALGPVGFILGWTPLLRKKVQKQARERLTKFMNS
ncbi:MAG TPA: nuclear transport factor 2 family protein [Pyrinomonadaceae bacterium]|nr:nuclear transport factor 2 family protein [Pyrinomonadaceae bacterium]